MLKTTIERLFSNEFFKNILTLFSGTVIAQIIPFLIAPVLTRIYSPANFGDLALFISISSVLSILYTGSYEGAILLPKKLNESFNLVGVSVLLVFIGGILFSIVSIFIKDSFKVFSNEHINHIALLVLPLVSMLYSFEKIFNSWHNRVKSYKRISSANVSKSAINGSCQLLLGKLKYLNFGLIFSEIAGRVFQSIILIIPLLKEKGREKLQISLITMKSMAKEHIDFPKFSLFSKFLNIISSQLPIFLLTFFFNQDITGFYSLTYKYLRAPLILLSSSISQVYYQKVAQMKNDEQDIGAFTFKMIKRFYLFSLIPFTIITVFGDVIFAFAFGKEWETAGIYAQYMSPWLLINISVSPISTVFFVLKKQKQGLIANFILFFTRIITLIIGGAIFKDSQTTIIIFGVAGFFFYIGYTMYVMKILKVNQLKIISLISYLIISLLVFFI
ncbi:lipopolysaccharide biosynthesis protein, partial [Bacteroidota bacterium]